MESTTLARVDGTYSRLNWMAAGVVVCAGPAECGVWLMSDKRDRSFVMCVAWPPLTVALRWQAVARYRI